MTPRGILILTLLPCLLPPVLGSYEPSGWSSPQTHGHSAGSYYHYHVPVVGHQQQYHPSHHNDHSHFLWPLLLLLALPLLFLPLLPLLLLPIGISLLALLAPGGMMMMMMMMMGGGMMMRTDSSLGSGRAFQQVSPAIIQDLSILATNYARSSDLDECPTKITCHLGFLMFPPDNSTTATATSTKQVVSYLAKYLPGSYEAAFWKGSANLSSCEEYSCRVSTSMGIQPIRPGISSKHLKRLKTRQETI